MRIFKQGDYYRVFFEQSPGFLSSSCVPRRKSKRGIITGFSNRSRSRLFFFLSRIVFNGALFVTLTSRRDVEYSLLVAFVKRFSRRYGSFPVVWRKEQQKRGVYHYHLLIFSRMWLPVSFVIQAWSDVVGESSSVSVRFADNRKWVYFYISKYIGKLEDGGGVHAPVNGDAATASVDFPAVDSGILDYTVISCRSTGRKWGYFFRGLFTFYPSEWLSVFDLSADAVFRLSSLVDYVRSNGFYCSSLRFVCYSGY